MMPLIENEVAMPSLLQDEGEMPLPNGGVLSWRRTTAGGRSYFSDEVGIGGLVWDTNVCALSTLQVAQSLEVMFERHERRTGERRQGERRTNERRTEVPSEQEREVPERRVAERRSADPKQTGRRAAERREPAAGGKSGRKADIQLAEGILADFIQGGAPLGAATEPQAGHGPMLWPGGKPQRLLANGPERGAKGKKSKRPEWRIEWKNLNGEVEVHGMYQDGQWLGSVTVDFKNRRFELGHFEDHLPWKAGQRSFVSMGWRDQLVNQARKALKEHVAANGEPVGGTDPSWRNSNN